MTTSANNDDLLDTISQQWQSIGLDADYQAIGVVGRLLRLSKTVETSVNQLHRRYGLKQGEFDVLATLKRHDQSMTPSQLYHAMLLSSGAMTSRLDRLEQKGLIKRRHCTQDRRSIKVALTTQGHDVIDLIYPAHFELIEALMSSQSTTDKQQLASLLKQWLSALEPDGKVV